MSPRPGRPRASASSGTTGAGSPATTAADRAAGGWRGALQAVRVRDPGGASLRRAARVAIVVPTLAALAGAIVSNPAASTFAVFGAFALLGLADFGGPTIPRARARPHRGDGPARIATAIVGGDLHLGELRAAQERLHQAAARRLDDALEPVGSWRHGNHRDQLTVEPDAIVLRDLASLHASPTQAVPSASHPATGATRETISPSRAAPCQPPIARPQHDHL
jgi:hypothetical protein